MTHDQIPSCASWSTGATQNLTARGGGLDARRPAGCSFLLAVGRFLLTVEFSLLTIVFGSFVTYNWIILAHNWSFLLIAVEASVLAGGICVSEHLGGR